VTVYSMLREYTFCEYTLREYTFCKVYFSWVYVL
jgi:hypothetical protein